MDLRSHKRAIVKTASGWVRGYFSDSVYVFHGIPYGGSVSGAERFKPATPPVPWQGMKDATRYGPAAPQMPLPTQTTVDAARRDGEWALVSENIFSAAFEPYQNEDCLVLNVWTPGLEECGKRAVMVRVHGGGFYSGSGAWIWHDGTHLAQRGDVVIVTLNHRLNAFGYLYLGDAMGPEFASGNVGITDLVLALRWVRNNISAFGGDPENVTIFGESGGGMKISCLLAMPTAVGLFQKAIIQSGAMPRVKTRAEATEETRRFLNEAHVAEGDIRKLQLLDVGAILEAQAAAGINPLPCIDDVTILEHPGKAIAKSAPYEVPIILGSTLTEGTPVHLSKLPELMNMGEAELQAKVSQVYEPSIADKLVQDYRRAYPNASPGQLFLFIEAASWMRRDMWDFADAKLQAGAQVYVYLLAWMSGAAEGMMMAAHGLCVPLSMDNVERSGPWTADFPESQRVADVMSEAWIAFAKTGNPSISGTIEWPAYNDGRRATMVFDLISKIVNDPNCERDIWRNIPRPRIFPALGWPGLIPL